MQWFTIVAEAVHTPLGSRFEGGERKTQGYGVCCGVVLLKISPRESDDNNYRLLPLTIADAPATIGHDMDVPLYAYSLQERSSVPSLDAEYICGANLRTRNEVRGRPRVNIDLFSYTISSNEQYRYIY